MNDKGKPEAQLQGIELPIDELEAENDRNDKDKLEAQLQGIELAIDKLDAEYNKGMIDIGRYTQLKTGLETRKAELEKKLASLELVTDKGGNSDEQDDQMEEKDSLPPVPSPEPTPSHPKVSSEKSRLPGGCINIRVRVRVVIIFLASIVTFSILIRVFIINTESKRTVNATQTALAIALATTSPSPAPWICPILEGTDEEILSQLIQAEARAVETKDMDLIRQIFAPQATVTDASAGTSSESALSYYEYKFKTENHKNITHTNLKYLEPPSTEAVVTCHAFGFWKSPGGDFMSYGPGDDRWEFKKIDDCWRVVAFTFNLPPSAIFLYLDAGVHSNLYFPDGWMGDGMLPNRVLFDDSWQDNPHSGQTSIKIAYTNQVEGWTGLYWLHPTHNWADNPDGGYDLTEADRLTFWARSDTPNVPISFLIGGVGYPDGTDCPHPSAKHPDSICPKIVQSENLSREWTKYTIDLRQHPSNWSSVIGGFGWVVKDKVTFYLDDIVYEFD